MICPSDALGDVGYLRGFRARIIEDRIPINLSLDLTSRCNLNCAHCYLGPSRTAPAELSLSELKSIMDQAAEAGSLYLLMTGGEPLLRSDFEDLYRYAKHKGFFVTVFTNGTKLTEKHLALFRDLPPWSVEVSVYGSTQSIYEGVTGAPGSFEACMRGIEMLSGAGVNLRLKTVMLTLNSSDISAIRRVAHRLGVRFHFDACVFPDVDGGVSPLRYRVDPSDAVAEEFSDPAERARWCDAVKSGGMGAVSDKLFLCGAGVTGMHVTATGQLQPCMVVKDVRYDLRSGSLAQGWSRISRQVSEMKTPESLDCTDCGIKNLCGYCPGTLRLEKGNYLEKSEYSCAIGSERLKEISKDPDVRARNERAREKYSQTTV